MKNLPRTFQGNWGIMSLTLLARSEEKLVIDECEAGPLSSCGRCKNPPEWGRLLILYKFVVFSKKKLTPNIVLLFGLPTFAQEQETAKKLQPPPPPKKKRKEKKMALEEPF